MEVSESETPILPASALDKQQQMDTMSSTSSNKDKEEIRRNSLSEPGDYPMDEDEMCKIDFDSLALFVDM
jgi:hypothetical protein